MKTLKFVMYLFYRYYAKGGTRRIPYFSALTAVSFLIYIHIFQFLIVLRNVNLLPMEENDSKGLKYWKMAIFSLPIFLIIAFLVRPSELRNSQYDLRKIRQGERYLIAYVVLSVLLLFLLIILIPKKG